MSKKIQILDTTLRDGSQMEKISFSVNDKIKIAHALDDYGVDYIEAGFPGSNVKEQQFFTEIQKEKFKKAKICAFGSTRYKKNKAKNDPSLNSIIQSGVKVAVIFGKTWDFQVTDILETSLEDNLDIIYTSITYLKTQGLEVIFDAEHFFDGYKDNPDYALKCLKAAEKAGCINLSLCDTNGGMLPMQISKVVQEVKKNTNTPLGIHTHNDTGCADANTVSAIYEGTQLIHTTVNGYGERTGNANLCVVVPNIVLKLKKSFANDIKLEKTKELSVFVSETANLSEKRRAPYVGLKSFSHKAGIHASGIAKNRRAYEHIDPSIVGNSSHILVSELSGKSNIIAKMKEFGLSTENKSEEIKKILTIIKDKENKGFYYEGADTSLYLLMKKIIENYQKPFEVIDFLIVNETNRREKSMLTEATIKIKVGEKFEHVVSSGNGPVNALDNAFRKALQQFFPIIEKVFLTDYKVRILDGIHGTGAIIRVLIESKLDNLTFATVGASENIIEASFEALTDAYSYAISLK